jgi:hypothetical protein
MLSGGLPNLPVSYLFDRGLLMTELSPSAQWDCLLKNSGTWNGSFTRLHPNGEIDSDTPTIVKLLPQDGGTRMHQTVERISATDAPNHIQTFDYKTLGRGVLFFDNGAFSQGSMQYGPFSQFGAEFGFTAGDRRMRLVPLFNTESHLASMTLIREQRQGSTEPERPPLTVDQLIGIWRGEAVTLYPDLRPPTRCRTTLTVQREGDRLTQSLLWSDRYITSDATISGNGSILQFEQGSQPIQLVLLPDGASSNTPLIIPKRRPFFLEAGWLVSPELRQRLIRSYDERGTWLSLTLVTERKD